MSLFAFLFSFIGHLIGKMLFLINVSNLPYFLVDSLRYEVKLLHKNASESIHPPWGQKGMTKLFLEFQNSK